MKKLPKLTKKQAGFVEDYVLTGNGEKAALNNYEIEGEDKGNIARSIASENLTKPNVAVAIEIQKETLKSALQKKGITPEKIADKINVLLDAEKVTRTYIKGELSTEVVEEDHNAIDKGLKHATNIYGIEDLDKTKPVNTTYNFIFNEQTQREIKKMENKIKERLLNGNV